MVITLARQNNQSKTFNSKFKKGINCCGFREYGFSWGWGQFPLTWISKMLSVAPMNYKISTLNTFQ